MAENNKVNKQTITSVSQAEAENWMFALIPIAVAFVFYIVFITYSDVENKNLFIAYGAAAGFIGFETFWIVRGIRRGHSSTVLLGITGIAATLGLLYFYLSIA